MGERDATAERSPSSSGCAHHRLARVQCIDARRVQERHRLGVPLRPAAVQRPAGAPPLGPTPDPGRMRSAYQLARCRRRCTLCEPLRREQRNWQVALGNPCSVLCLPVYGSRLPLVAGMFSSLLARTALYAVAAVSERSEELFRTLWSGTDSAWVCRAFRAHLAGRDTTSLVAAPELACSDGEAARHPVASRALERLSA